MKPTPACIGTEVGILQFPASGRGGLGFVCPVSVCSEITSPATLLMAFHLAILQRAYIILCHWRIMVDPSTCDKNRTMSQIVEWIATVDCALYLANDAVTTAQTLRVFARFMWNSVKRPPICRHCSVLSKSGWSLLSLDCCFLQLLLLLWFMPELLGLL